MNYMTQPHHHSAQRAQSTSQVLIQRDRFRSPYSNQPADFHQTSFMSRRNEMQAPAAGISDPINILDSKFIMNRQRGQLRAEGGIFTR